MGKIEMKNICKSFGSTKVIENLNLTVEDGEFVVLVGASGCGKTTLLRIMAGIGPATSGELWLDGKEISRLPPGKRNVAMVFQNYAIYPNMSVRKNIEFGLINNKVPKKERERLIQEVCSGIGLMPYLDRRPGELSGGQRQRVALARAMVKNPAVFLMDEPLSNLDARLRALMRTELIELHRKLGTTFVYVTHDQVEAMSMADTIVLLNNGAIQQQSSPKVMYNDPNNIFTARFIGTPPMNILPFGEFHVGFRAEKARLYADDRAADGDFVLKGTIVTREMLGAETLYKLQLNEADTDYKLQLNEADTEEETLMIKMEDDSFDEGAAVRVCLGLDSLYYFDKDGNRIRETENPDAFRECTAFVKGRGGK